jgi:hypothetical protein
MIKIRRHYYYKVDTDRELPAVNSDVTVVAVDVNNCSDVAVYDPRLVDKFRRFHEEGQQGMYGYVDGRFVAYAWAILNTKGKTCRVRGFFPLPAGAACVHYCRVMDEYRGRKIYQTMLIRMYEALYSMTKEIYLDTEVNNQPANRAVMRVNGMVTGYLTLVLCAGRKVITFMRRKR